jgi:hypothetical protein
MLGAAAALASMSCKVKIDHAHVELSNKFIFANL